MSILNLLSSFVLCTCSYPSLSSLIYSLSPASHLLLLLLARDIIIIICIEKLATLCRPTLYTIDFYVLQFLSLLSLVIVVASYPSYQGLLILLILLLQANRMRCLTS